MLATDMSAIIRNYEYASAMIAKICAVGDGCIRSSNSSGVDMSNAGKTIYDMGRVILQRSPFESPQVIVLVGRTRYINALSPRSSSPSTLTVSYSGFDSSRGLHVLSSINIVRFL